jgi:cold shock CspA family protein
MLGTVQSYLPLDSYGFIIPDSEFRARHFFHLSNYNGNVIPRKGLRVEYDLAPGRKPGQIQAIKVIPAVTR